MTERRVEPTPWREVFQGKRGRLVTGLLMLEALVAIYALVVTTIMPAVRDDLGKTQLYGFAFAVWGLATILTIPIAGHAADRFGPRKPLLVVLGVQVCGLAVSGLAPSMEIVILGLFLQGCAGGALYAVSLGTVAKTFPADVRARVMALLATMWILPGLIGPMIGALIASTVGWRWAFALPVPLLILAASLVLPSLGDVKPDPEAAALPILRSVQVTIGLGLMLGGLTAQAPYNFIFAAVGLAIGLPGLLHIVPRGTFSARRGVPAAALAMFLLSGAFFTVDSFIPLMLRKLHDFSYFKAGLVITVATVTWSAGSLWQSRVAQRIPPGTLVTIGASLVFVGMLGVACGLSETLPIWLVYVGWTAAGGGMGIAFPTIPLSVMSVAEEGKEAGQLSSTLLMDTLGMTIGAGLGGASIAFATAPPTGDEGLRAGIAGAYLIGFVMIGLLLMIARRIPGLLAAKNE